MIESFKYLKKIIETKYNRKLIVIVCSEFKQNDFLINKLKEMKLAFMYLSGYFINQEYRINNNEPRK